MDVLIAGAGPAGLALADACSRRGLATTVVDPAPARPWSATYGVWADEAPDLPFAASPLSTVAYGATQHVVERRYRILDNAALRARFTGYDVLTGHIEGAEFGRHGATVQLTDGRRLATALVVDASGARRVLSGGPPRGARAEQTAYGLVLPEKVLPADPAVFMDWRDRDGTFRYTVPLGGGRVLVEQTSLARRPGVPIDVLSARLRAFLAASGIPAYGREERVRIVLDVPPPGRGPVLPFGVAAGFVHPATGYSLATSLALAPVVAEALASARPREAVRAAKRAMWSPAARSVQALRRFGLHALQTMPDPAEFFDLFFTLPVTSQRAFTSGREDVRGTAGAMLALFRAAPPRIRRQLAGWPV